MKGNIKGIKMYYFHERTQSSKYKKQIDELKDGEAIVHVDYSENYKNKQQNEIKFAYYGQEQFSLFTVCIYIKARLYVKATHWVTLENAHSCNASFALNNFLSTKSKRKLRSLPSNFGVMVVPVNFEVNLHST